MAQTLVQIQGSSPALAFDPVVRWLRYKSPRTVQQYSATLRRFLGSLEPSLGITSPGNLLQWARTRVDSLEVEEIIEQFAESRSLASRPIIRAALKTFLERNGVKMAKIPSEPAPIHYIRGYNREEIQRVLSFLDSDFQKLYVLIGKDCGLRANTILQLSYRHIAPDLEAGLDYCHLYLEPYFYQGKKKAGLTFLGPNSLTLLKELIANSLIDKNSKRSLFPFGYNSIRKSLLLAKNKARLDPTIQANHGLRKFFENCLDKTVIDHHKKLQIEGHSAGSRDHYTSRDIDELRTLYKAAYVHLDLSEQGAATVKLKESENIFHEQQDRIKLLEAYREKLEAELAKYRTANNSGLGVS